MNITNVKLILTQCALANDTLLMEGLHGIGKSEVVSTFAKENNYHMETLFLSHQEVGDLIGMPRTIEKDGEMLTSWTKPVWLQRLEEASANGQKTVLFLDELNRAPLDVRQSALQLVLEGKIHEHELPVLEGNKTLIVAAINPSDDADYQVDALDAALLDRFLHVDVEVDARAWLDWSLANNVNEVVRSYIIDNPSKLHYTPKEGTGATPRSWTKLGKFIDNVENIPGEVLFDIIKGKIGSELGFQFQTFLKNYVDVVGMKDVHALVMKESKNTKDINVLADAVSELTLKMESIQKTDLLKQMAEEYLVPDADETSVLPCLAMLYSVPVEILNSFLKSTRESNPERYKILVKLDKDMNNKALFIKVTQAFMK